MMHLEASLAVFSICIRSYLHVLQAQYINHTCVKWLKIVRVRSTKYNNWMRQDKIASVIFVPSSVRVNTFTLGRNSPVKYLTFTSKTQLNCQDTDDGWRRRKARGEELKIDGTLLTFSSSLFFVGQVNPWVNQAFDQGDLQAENEWILSLLLYEARIPLKNWLKTHVFVLELIS